MITKFKSLDVCNILKITLNQLQYLVFKCELIKPEIIGRDWYFNFNDLIEIKICYKIKKAGFALNRLKNAKEFFKENDLENSFSDKNLIVCDKTLYLYEKDKTGDFLIGISGKNERQIALKVIDLDAVVSELIPFKNNIETIKTA